ncbi:MAG: type II toxin-antitoxin system Phd/YefM family antitoxin [Acetobacteraceae bacterium]|jgi:prevent-host-death family protein
MSDVWQAATARHRFSEVVDAAVEGRPQFVRRRDGREVVVVSREYFEKTKPSLKAILQAVRFGRRGDEFDSALNEARGSLAESLTPRALSPENKGDNYPGDERSE